MSLAISSRYANALADVVLGNKDALQPQAVVEQLKSLEEIVASSSDLRNVLNSPAVTMSKKSAIISHICKSINMDRIVQNFVYIVVRNRRAMLIPQIRVAFERALDDRTGLVKTDIASAAELSPSAQASLEAQLAKLTGKRVRCQYNVDPALLGGVIARIGSTVYDGSVRGQLEVLRRKLTT